ncbi:protein RUFY3 isoform X6 [Pantherophis guttatus]|uniref:Protein RUFY3 isoform X6 n=1 Tax=Pantherophis guttatus TaxID=94885 RepID=A0A6P9CRL3_PANGU|nr:protein RUFY3 isoform X6 [Pantherophis guttatus]
MESSGGRSAQRREAGGEADGEEEEEEEAPPPDSPPFFLLYPGRGGGAATAAPGAQPQSAWRAAPPGPCGAPLPVLLSYIGPEPAQPRTGGAHSWEDLTDLVEQLRDDTEDPNYVMANERMNLMNMAKLSIKGLIESALNLGRTLDSDYAPLQQFFVVMEHCLKHGLKAKKTFLGQNKSFWGPLELVEKFVPEAGEITASVKDLPGLKTPVGRGRAWLRLALMQKKLSEYMKALINRREILSEFYEANALMMEEEGAIIAGLLVGLNVIDANFCMKGEDLDSQVGVIDFSMYLKDGSSSKGSEGDGQITAILDQKNYVEELNRHLSATVNNLQAKVDALEKSNTKLTEELAVANNRIITLQEEMERVKEESSYILESNRKVNKQDRTADGHALTEARKQLKEETQLRLSSDLGMKQKSELNSRLEEKTSQMAATIKLLEQRLQLSERERQSLQEDNRLFKEEFGDKINSLQVEVEQLTKQRGQLEVELRREREQWLHLPHGVPDSKSLFSLNKGIQKTGSKIDSSDRHLEGDSQSRTSAKENTVLSSSVFPDLQDEQDQRPDKSKPCQLCQEESTRSKRKNICKNCGGVFCEDCSASELPLPSSIKPERVCNLCHKHLIQQYSASPS